MKLDSDNTQRHDAFNREKYVNYLMKIIKQSPQGNNFIIGIEAEWGAGKTFIFEKLKEQLNNNNINNEINNNQESSISYSCVDYSPWLVTGKHALVQELLKVLAKELKGKGNQCNIKQLLKFSSYSKALSNNTHIIKSSTIELILILIINFIIIVFFLLVLLEPQTLQFIVSTVVLNILYNIGLLLIKSNLDFLHSPQYLKQKIIDSLPKNHKTIIFIDDIDRLPPNEIHDLFQAIKCVADFPNIIYILAYDHSIVSNSLSNKNIDFDGAVYLEKIIQLSTKLPRLGDNDIINFLESKLKSIGYDLSGIDKQRLKDMGSAIAPLLKTPRAVIRLCNALTTLQIELNIEIDSLDLLGMEVLRLHEPKLWNAIRDEPSFMSIDKFYSQSLESNDKEFEESINKNSENIDKKMQDNFLEKLPLLTKNARTLFLEIFDKKIRSSKTINNRIHNSSNEDRLLYYFSISGRPDIYTIKELKEFITVEGLKNYLKNNDAYNSLNNILFELDNKNINVNMIGTADIKDYFYIFIDGLKQFDDNKSNYHSNNAKIIFPNINEIEFYNFIFEMIQILLNHKTLSELDIIKKLKDIPIQLFGFIQSNSSKNKTISSAFSEKIKEDECIIYMFNKNKVIQELIEGILYQIKLKTDFEFFLNRFECLKSKLISSENMSEEEYQQYLKEFINIRDTEQNWDSNGNRKWQ